MKMRPITLKCLRKCYRALEPGGLMIIKDHIMNADLTEPKAGAIFALYLLMATRGRDYSFDEVSRWLGDAGFVDIKLEALPSPPFTSSMVIARKPIVRNFIVRRIASVAIVMVLAAVCSGCARGAVGAVTTIAPVVAAGSAQLIGSQVAMKQDSGNGASKDGERRQMRSTAARSNRRRGSPQEQGRADRVAPVENRPDQRRSDLDSGSHAEREHARRTRGSRSPASPSCFSLRRSTRCSSPTNPNISPTLPTEIVNVSDSEQFDSMTEAFGSGVGTFKWRDRSYTFVLVKELPCFKPEKEK